MTLALSSLMVPSEAVGYVPVDGDLRCQAFRWFSREAQPAAGWPALLLLCDLCSE